MGTRNSKKKEDREAKPCKAKRRRQLAPKPTVKRVNASALMETIDRARLGAISEEECAELRGVVDTLEYVVRELDQKNLSLRRLRCLFGLPSSEKLKDVLPDEDTASEADGESRAEGEGEGETRPANAEGEDSAPTEGSKAPGHGRNGADAYVSADRVRVPHTCFAHGDPCPRCATGKLYEQRHAPRLLVRVEGQAPLKATVYELQAFRCNLCGEVFVADPPEGVGEAKYDATSKGMIALLKYGTGLPFHRLERLEGHLGVPLPASTQWDVVEGAAHSVKPAYTELIRIAAQGDLLHNDDSSMRVLSLMKENADRRKSGDTDARTGIFVTGVVSVTEGRRIALFFTGRQHAGENLQDVLDQRVEELGPPMLMCDGSSCNDPAHADTVRGACLTHGRRRFVDVAESFPVECKHVLEVLAKVYKHDAEARERDLSPEARLVHHVELSKPLLDELEEWFEAQLDEKKVEPNSSLGGAINYMLNRWEELTLFLREPGAPLDNNVCERALKKAILHRRNSLFYKTPNGAAVGDLFMSLIHTAELCGANPFDYLTELLRNEDEVARAPGEWMPWNYREALAAIRED